MRGIVEIAQIQTKMLTKARRLWRKSEELRLKVNGTAWIVWDIQGTQTKVHGTHRPVTGIRENNQLPGLEGPWTRREDINEPEFRRKKTGELAPRKHGVKELADSREPGGSPWEPLGGGNFRKVFDNTGRNFTHLGGDNSGAPLTRSGPRGGTFKNHRECGPPRD